MSEAKARRSKPGHYPQHLHLPGGRTVVVSDPLEHEQVLAKAEEQFEASTFKNDAIKEQLRSLLEKGRADLEAAKVE